MSYWENLASRAYPGDWVMKAKGQAMDDDRRKAKIRTQIKSKQDEIFNLSLILDSESTRAERDRLAREIRDLEAQMYR
jgi:signal transduction histidine kinase